MKDSQTAALEFESGNLDVVRLAGEIVDLYKENGFKKSWRNI